MLSDKMNKMIKGSLLFIILLFITVSAVNAADVLNDTSEEVNTYHATKEIIKTAQNNNYMKSSSDEETINELNNTIKELNNTIKELNETINNQSQTIEELNNTINELTKPSATTIKFDPIDDTKYGQELTITGMLFNEDGVSLTNQEISINYNNEITTVTTRNGEFKYTTTPYTVGENTITAYYAGTKKNNETIATTTFEVAKLDSIINIEYINAVKKGENITITGTLVDENSNPLAKRVVRILVNNGRKTLKTDENGVYSFNYTTSRVGTNTINATFEGDEYHAESSTHITAEVNALKTMIKMDYIQPVLKENEAIISGTLTDENGEIIANAQVRILINGSPKTLKTDENGVFTYVYKLYKVGKNNVTVSYAGSNNYKACSASESVTVIGENINITINPVTPVKKTYAAVQEGRNITGRITDSNGVPIANLQIKINYYGSYKTLKTDSNGEFTYVCHSGSRRVELIVEFKGNNKYAATSKKSNIQLYTGSSLDDDS